MSAISKRDERTARKREAHARRAVSMLSPAEGLVFRLLLRGMSAKRIGEQLDRSPFTISNHTRKIFHAFGVNSRSAVIAYFVQEPPAEWFEAAP